MIALGLRSLRQRPTAAVATFLAVLLGTALTASFATLVESSFGAADDDRELLIVIGGIVGGWSALIVLFSVVSTVGIVSDQRAREAALLRTIGATPRQARALIVSEAVAVAVVAACVGGLIAAIGGSALFGALRHGNLVTSASRYAGGPASLSVSAGVIVLVAAVAAVISSRRATRGPAGSSRRQVAVEHRLPWWRGLVGALLVTAGLTSAIITVTVTGKASEAYPAMQTSGSASVVVGVGLATLAPVLLRRLAAPFRRLLAGSGSGQLAAANTARRAHLLAGTLAPVIVLVSSSVGTLLMVGIDGRTLAAAGDPEGVGSTITMINSIIVGMICLFAAIMVVNSSVAIAAARRAELDRLWRLGATAGQLRASVVLEAAVVAGIGIVLGLLGSTATAVPYAVVRHEGLVPDGQLWLPPLVACVAAVLTVGAAWAAQRRPGR